MAYEYNNAWTDPELSDRPDQQESEPEIEALTRFVMDDSFDDDHGPVNLNDVEPDPIPYSMLTHNGGQLAKAANYYRAEVKRLQRENERLEARVDELTVSLLDPPHYLRSKVAQLEAEKAELEKRIGQIAAVAVSPEPYAYDYGEMLSDIITLADKPPDMPTEY